MSKRDLGGMGENTLGKWASQVDIAATKSQPDKSGWDFILDFPQPDDSSERISLPFDRLPRPIQCLVQVKSTDGRDGKKSVKLRNWLRLVKTPLPAFLLVLEFDAKDDCQRAYLVHIDRQYISRVLKRLRELEPSEYARLHKHKLQFEWEEKHELPSLNGKGLEEAIRRHVVDVEAYARQKTEELSTAGYEDGGWQLDVILPMPQDRRDPQEILVDWSLGLIPHLDVIQGSVWDSRFGVRAPEPAETFNDGMLEASGRKAVATGTVLLTLPDEQKELRISTDVYVPQGIGFDLKPDQIKARFAAPFIDFIFWPSQEGKADTRYELPKPSETHSLAQLQPVSAIVLMLADAIAGSGRIEFQANLDLRPLYVGQLDVRGPLSRQVVDYAAAIVNAWTIAKHFDIHQDVELRPSELLQQQDRLKFMASVLGPTRASVGIQFQSSQSPPNNDKSMCLPFVTDAVLGQHRVTIALAMIGQQKETDRTRREDVEWREYTIETRDVRLCYQQVCSRDQPPRYTFKDLAQSVIEDYEESCNILRIEAINDYLKDAEGED